MELHLFCSHSLKCAQAAFHCPLTVMVNTSLAVNKLIQETLLILSHKAAFLRAPFPICFLAFFNLDSELSLARCTATCISGLLRDEESILKCLYTVSTSVWLGFDSILLHTYFRLCQQLKTP